MGRPRKNPLPVVEAPGEYGAVDAIKAGIAEFKSRHPHEWEVLRLCPLQHGLERIIEAME